MTNKDILGRCHPPWGKVRVFSRESYEMSCGSLSLGAAVESNQGSATEVPYTWEGKYYVIGRCDDAGSQLEERLKEMTLMIG